MTELTPRVILDAIRRGLEATGRQFTDSQQADQRQRHQAGNEKDRNVQPEAKTDDC